MISQLVELGIEGSYFVKSFSTPTEFRRSFLGVCINTRTIKDTAEGFFQSWPFSGKNTLHLPKTFGRLKTILSTIIKNLHPGPIFCHSYKIFD
jgi:hypothetical protein